MPTLTQVRDAAAEMLRKALPKAVRVEAFAGEIDLAGLAQKGVAQGGSLYVAVLSAVNAGTGLDFDMRAGFACFALGRAARPEDREAEALALAEAAALALHGATFGLAGVSPALVDAVAPVPDEAVEKSGVSVWAVTWAQHIIFNA